MDSDKSLKQTAEQMRKQETGEGSVQVRKPEYVLFRSPEEYRKSQSDFGEVLGARMFGRGVDDGATAVGVSRSNFPISFSQIAPSTFPKHIPRVTHRSPAMGFHYVS